MKDTDLQLPVFLAKFRKQKSEKSQEVKSGLAFFSETSYAFKFLASLQYALLRYYNKSLNLHVLSYEVGGYHYFLKKIIPHPYLVRPIRSSSGQVDQLAMLKAFLVWYYGINKRSEFGLRTGTKVFKTGLQAFFFNTGRRKN